MNIKELEKKVAQLFIVGMPGTRLDQRQIDFYSRIGVGGYILFDKNFESVAQLVELTNSIQKFTTSDAWKEWPAFVSVDQEGGRVIRFKKQFTQFPPQKLWGELSSPKMCYEAGYVIAKELRAAGININFAPVLDVLQKETTNAIGDRSYSSDPEVVANLGSATSRGLQKGGVVSVLKHFPGHGGVSVDTHIEAPICHKSLEELNALDWIPFRKAIRARADGVMTSHIFFSQLDKDRLATLSRKIIQEYLRKDLRFSKLVFTDDLDMGGIGKKYSLEEAVFLAIEAGCDQLLLCHSYEQLEDLWRHLVQAFESGALPMQRLDESLARIEDVKKRYLLPFKFAHKELAEVLVGSPAFQEVATAIKNKQILAKGPSESESQKA